MTIWTAATLGAPASSSSGSSSSSSTSTIIARRSLLGFDERPSFSSSSSSLQPPTRHQAQSSFARVQVYCVTLECNDNCNANRMAPASQMMVNEINAYSFSELYPAARSAAQDLRGNPDLCYGHYLQEVAYRKKQRKTPPAPLRVDDGTPTSAFCRFAAHWPKPPPLTAAEQAQDLAFERHDNTRFYACIRRCDPHLVPKEECLARGYRYVAVSPP
ncbi:MAG: hypothetical protein M1826_001070 [Phylliscum demangeonii]|nr:MAG: hypothetical protein M1826_001070 [Phylliscum demangeonii]